MVSATSAIGYAAGALVGVLQLPQVLQTRRTQDVSGVSTASLALHLINGITWWVYGLLLGEYPILMANTLYVAANLYLVRCVYCWKADAPSGAQVPTTGSTSCSSQRSVPADTKT